MAEHLGTPSNRRCTATGRACVWINDGNYWYHCVNCGAEA